MRAELTGDHIVSENTCIACRHWILREKNNKGEYIPHEMAALGFGICAHDEKWHYFPGHRECANNKFEPIAEDLRIKREEWEARNNKRSKYVRRQHG